VRFQVSVSTDELVAIDDFRFGAQMPNRSVRPTGGKGIGSSINRSARALVAIGLWRGSASGFWKPYLRNDLSLFNVRN
jgi:hypothetical protein